jgi:hypothetical protein
MKNYLLIFVLTLSLQSFAQYSVSAGTSMIKAFGVQGVYPGFHIGLELSKDEQSTLYGRIGIYPGKKNEAQDGIAYTISKDGSANPYSYPLTAMEKYNYTIIELGKRFYFGNGFDNGFGFYGGSNLNFVFNKVQFTDIQKYDAAIYDLYVGDQLVKDESRAFGSIFGLSFGLNAGIKNSFYFGTLYLDGGISYPILAQPSNIIASYTSMYKPLIFSVSLGFRKDFY